VYSDGIADAEASDGVAQFGKERIIKTLEAHSGPAQRIARDLIEQIDNFTSGWPQFDDMCLVCFQRIDSTP
jgi:serine phosphatase RsbU (regulator of sigma subunit)